MKRSGGVASLADRLAVEPRKCTAGPVPAQDYSVPPPL